MKDIWFVIFFTEWLLDYCIELKSDKRSSKIVEVVAVIVTVADTLVSLYFYVESLLCKLMLQLQPL